MQKHTKPIPSHHSSQDVLEPNTMQSRSVIFRQALLRTASMTFTLLGLILSTTAWSDITDKQLKNLIECRSNYAQYRALTEDYDHHLAQLGWHRVENTDQAFIYIYQHSKPVSLFGQTTQQIGLTGNAIVAIFRDVNAQKLAQQHGLTQHEFFIHAPYFRGEKVLRTEPPEDEHIPVHHKLMLSEMTGSDPITLLGCNYELDREAMEKAIADLEL